ncbi:MAG: hypothetical protein KGL35_12755 [Bradyrhizobium sp.]|nr:hypothetical protein [Pseudomonadota bacterium]MDE2469580.1 hypothetical protein [Bradyrhizobium sp.]
MPGNAAARDDAVALTRRLKHGHVTQAWGWDRWFIKIVDMHGHKIDEVPIADA